VKEKPRFELREARTGDLAGIVNLDAERSGERKTAWWRALLDEYVQGGARRGRVALVAADAEGSVRGYLFGEVRAWEFGSERCGWIFSVAVCPTLERGGLATALCQEAAARFEALGVDLVRTMVRRNDVPMLALFRSMGYRAGPFSELECRIAAAAPVVRRTQRRKKEVV
jgi:ribosomal protein S18 acetylase RimI-like enzyme